MGWKLESAPALITAACKVLYNEVMATDLPETSGAGWGINEDVWGELITLTRGTMKGLGYPLPAEGDWKGLCVYASVIAKKFLVHHHAWQDTTVVRLHGGKSDHYFVVVRNAKQVGICDITCGQFNAATHYLVSWLSDVKGTANKIDAGGNKLYDAYKKAADNPKEAAKKAVI